MGRWSRRNIDDAFGHYREVVLTCGRTGDWSPFADLFTEDATYIEHAFGTLGGREAIRRWITTTMSTFPGDAMPHFPVEWYMIDEDRGWLSCQLWNRMADPGDGSVHQAPNFTLLKYAGDNVWSYEEDIYNPQAFADMITRWQSVRDRLQATTSGAVAPTTTGTSGP
jgi:hypothetical protein